MDIKTECQICNSKLATYICKLCGRNVCENCYNKNSGLCLNCKQGKKL